MSDSRKSRPIQQAKEAIDMMMKKYEASDLPPKGHFHYHQGVFLSGVYKNYCLCGDEKYLEYIKGWIDSCITEDGTITDYEPGQIDDIQPGILLYPLIDKFGKNDQRYEKAIDNLIKIFDHYPRTADGGLWHRAWMEGQLWLDGLYMAGPIMAEYSQRYSRTDLAETVIKHVKSICYHNKDEKSGLLFHAYDETGNEPWADKKTGLSPEIWGRSVGWVPVAILDDLDFIYDHEGAKDLEKIVIDLLTALLKYQGENGMWYQVINKIDMKGNWPETSCTCLFAAAMFKALRKNILSENRQEFLLAATKAYNSVISRLTYDENGNVEVGGVCIGTGVGNYQFYCERPTSVNDLHGVGAFLLMCAEAEQVIL